MEDFIQNYLRGIYKKTDISEQYSEMLQQIKYVFRILFAIKIHDATAEKPIIDATKFKKGILQILLSGGALILYTLIVNLIFRMKMPDFFQLILAILFLTHMYFLIGNTCRLLTDGKLESVVLIIIILGIAAIFSQIILVVICVLIFLTYFFQGLGIVLKHQKLVNELSQKKIKYTEELHHLQQQMTALLPKMKQECLIFQQKNVPEKNQIYTEDNIFPEEFWWQGSIDEVDKVMKLFDIRRLGNKWETKSVLRTVGTQFTCDEEYSPLHLTEGFTIEDYNKVVNGDKLILDFISRCTSIDDVNEKIIRYVVPKHDAWDIFTKSSKISDLDRRVNDLYYKTGVLDKNYATINSLHADMEDLKDRFNAYANETEEHTYVEYTPIHKNVDMWSGQIILKKISNGYKIIDYYCQIPHMFENLQVLTQSEYNITYMDYDLYNCNKSFLVNFYAAFPECI